MKNEAIEVLMNRRSVRKFKAEQITDEALKTVLDAGTYAPTAVGQQRPLIVVLQDKARRDALAALNARARGSNSTGNPYYDAPTIIVVLAPDDQFGPLDAASVQTNMLNAAYACGLGSCWIHVPKKTFDSEDGKAMLRGWGVDESLCGVCSIALGYADCEAPAAAPRKADYYKIIR